MDVVFFLLNNLFHTHPSLSLLPLTSNSVPSSYDPTVTVIAISPSVMQAKVLSFLGLNKLLIEICLRQIQSSLPNKTVALAKKGRVHISKTESSVLIQRISQMALDYVSVITLQ